MVSKGRVHDSVDRNVGDSRNRASRVGKSYFFVGKRKLCGSGGFSQMDPLVIFAFVCLYFWKTCNLAFRVHKKLIIAEMCFLLVWEFPTFLRKSVGGSIWPNTQRWCKQNT